MLIDEGSEKTPTEDEKALIRDSIEDGATLQQIADMFGVVPPAPPVSVKNLYMRQWYRFKVVTRRNGKNVILDAPYKRDKPDNCEICGRLTKHLGYHHWDDDNPSEGLWLCWPCHNFAERVDKGMVVRYMTVRERAIKEVVDSIMLADIEEQLLYGNTGNPSR